MTIPQDIIGRPINVGDYVVFTNNIYAVTGLGKVNSTGGGQVRIMLLDSSPSTRPVSKYSTDMCILPKADMLVWANTN
jgi:hypothetical protein